jgi:predicted RNase H-like nuclease
MVSSFSYRLAGIDIAWRAGNGSAMAFGELKHRVLSVDKVVHQHFSAAAMGQLLLAEEVHGVAIDGPTVIPNQTGMRHCERAVISAFGRRGVACYPANLNLWADCQSLQVSHWLQHHGYVHAGSQPAVVTQQPWQIECYPHAALLELFQLPYRLAYKKGAVAARVSGQQQLAQLLLSLQQRQPSGLQLKFAPILRQQMLDIDYIGGLRGSGLKANEDCLDALVCLVIAAFHQAQQSQVFGTDEQGFIVVPRQPPK